jgi:serine protease Do
VRADSPAAKAGLKAGDVLVSFAGKPVNNLYDFTYLLQGSKVGDVIEVKVLREGKEHLATVTLESRR